MSKDCLSRRNERHSIKQRDNPVNGAFFNLADPDNTVDAITYLRNDNRSLGDSDPQVSAVFSTADLISVVNDVRDSTSQALSVLFSKTAPVHRTKASQNSDISYYSNEEETCHTSTSAYAQPCFGYSTCKKNYAKSKQENVDFEKRDQNMLPSYECYSSWRRLHARSTLLSSFMTDSCSGSRAGKTPNLVKIYRWMSEVNFAKTKHLVNLARIDNHMTHDNCTVHLSNSATSSVYANTICSTSKSRNSGSDSEAMEPIDLSQGAVANLDSKASALCSGNDILQTQKIDTPILNILPASSDTGSQETHSVSSIHDINVLEAVDSLHEDTSVQEITFFKADCSEVETNLSVKEEPCCKLAKQEHAFAGAMAGIFVSICLHPMDTIKTIVQSCHANQKSLHYIGRSIVSERGVMGLYRGISSNIISSAPISAVYTFTYESVKKNLLPLLPKEYHSLAHCMAGGCASIATSFIFTPSERIKQQMQVGSSYRNSWNVLVEVVHKGGLRSLYAGWGAVLCRNVPHSAIKFYTYESLKVNMLPSVHTYAQANALVALVCGGLAGSIASLFTTPFDVVKTRLQTQIPGSIARYNGVFNTLTDIGRHEGLKGLYRGLTPRLVMYMIQGALFFASYESFKNLLSLEIPQTSSHVIRHAQSDEDDSTKLHSLLLVSA